MNKPVLIWFTLVVGIVLLGVPVLGYVVKQQQSSKVEAASAQPAAKFEWNEKTLPGTGWNHVHRVPVLQGGVQAGQLDVDMMFEFVSDHRVKLTANVFASGGVPGHLAQALSGSQEGSYQIGPHGAVSTTLLNPMRDLGYLGISQPTNIDLLIHENKMYFAPQRFKGTPPAEYEAKRFF